MYDTLRPLLFRLDPETAHHLTLGLLKWAGDLPATRELLRAMFDVQDERLAVRAFGVHFKNPIGLAAGYDKNGIAVRGLAALGFGHIEVGTVTRLPQAGNAKPRVWRVPESRALVNRMGFPNNGMQNIRLPRTDARLGVNIGKGRDTPLESAAEDYIALLQAFHAHADYIAINVSSPNTPGLRALQARDAIEPLLRQIADARAALSPRVPLLVKIAPDLSDDEIDGIVQAARDVAFDGIIATNTTVTRAGVPAYAKQWEGGLSGAPLRARSTQVIRHIAAQTRGEFPIIGVGGVSDAASALEKLHAGATLIQILTGLVYRGPRLVREINEALLRENLSQPKWVLHPA
ncbi:MAG: quinone-dependent dihydroorotate dehydrogenase [Chloroflexi bacterium]|nr:quinone-dependent dihydroorotate dehydrogenase [Chloroflexota bacterium]